MAVSRSVTPLNGAFRTMDGQLRNLDGTIGPNANYDSKMPLLNATFVGADGRRHDIGELIDSMGGGGGGGGYPPLSGIPESDLSLAVQQKLNNPSSNCVAITGSTMTGPLTLSQLPTTDMQAANKSYVDNTIDAHDAVLELEIKELSDKISESGSVKIETGDTPGTIKYNQNDGAYTNVLVKGLGSAAFTASSSYATYIQGAKADSAYQKLASGIPLSDLAADVQTKINNAATEDYVDAELLDYPTTTQMQAAIDAAVSGSFTIGGTVETEAELPSMAPDMELWHINETGQTVYAFNEPQPGGGTVLTWIPFSEVDMSAYSTTTEMNAAIQAGLDINRAYTNNALANKLDLTSKAADSSLFDGHPITDFYQKPAGGIALSDLSSDVQESLGLADTALQTETDPTVPAWAKNATKPSYTASEVGALPTSATVNNKPYVSNNVTLTAADVGAATTAQGALASSAYQKPATGIPLADLASEVTNSLNAKLEDAPSDGKVYGRKDANWSEIPSIDLSPYYTKTEIDEMLEGYMTADQVIVITNQITESLTRNGSQLSQGERDTVLEMVNNALLTAPGLTQDEVEDLIQAVLEDYNATGGTQLTEAQIQALIDDAIANINFSDFYTKAEIDAKIAAIVMGNTNANLRTNVTELFQFSPAVTDVQIWKDDDKIGNPQIVIRGQDINRTEDLTITAPGGMGSYIDFTGVNSKIGFGMTNDGTNLQAGMFAIPITAETDSSSTTIIIPPEVKSWDMSYFVGLSAPELTSSYWTDMSNVSHPFSLSDTTLEMLSPNTAALDYTVNFGTGSTSNHNIKEIVFGSDYNSVTSIPTNFLLVMDKMTKLDLTGLKNVTTIGDNFLYACFALPYLNLRPLTKLTTLGNAFVNGGNVLTSIDFPSITNQLTIGDNFCSSCGFASIDLTPLSNIISFGTGFMNANKNLTSITLPSIINTQTISADFLRLCESLPTIDLTAFRNVTRINDSFLEQCYGLTSVDLTPLTNITFVDGHFFNGCRSLKAINLSPLNRITEIGDSFLTGCASLTSIDLTPLSNVTGVLGGVFLSGCNKITSIDLTPLSKITSITDGFIENCSSLTTLNVPLPNVTSVGIRFLNGLNNLKTLDLSKMTSLKTIGVVSFGTLSSLETLICGSVDFYNGSAFGSTWNYVKSNPYPTRIHSTQALADEFALAFTSTSTWTVVIDPNSAN